MSTDNDWFQETLRIRWPDGSYPTRLYKFLSPDSQYFEVALRDALLSSRVRLSCRTDFNDPFDTRFGIDFPDYDMVVKFIEGIAARSGSEKRPDSFIERLKTHPDQIHAQIRKTMNSSLDEFGIFCLTENIWHPLMWAHYASSHRGLALVFRHGVKYNWGAFPVRYEKDFPRTTIGADGLDLHHAFVKGRDWSYEHEWRIVEPKGKHQYKIMSPEHFAGVVFGSAATQATYDMVLAIIKERARANLPPLLVYRAEASESFKLRFYQFVGADEWKLADFLSQSD